jgi:hypothetical protein
VWNSTSANRSAGATRRRASRVAAASGNLTTTPALMPPSGEDPAPAQREPRKGSALCGQITPGWAVSATAPRRPDNPPEGWA